MTNYEFYIEVKRTLIDMAKLKNISEAELEKYYFQTDTYSEFYTDLSGINRIFAQLLFHAQNATMISNIVKFEKNYLFLKKITHGFNPKCFLDYYSSEDAIEEIVEDLRAKNGEGLVWNSDKSKNKNGIAKRYANTMLECAKYLNNFSNESEVLSDLKNNYANYKELISYFRSKIKYGFSVALSADFLKEFNPLFDLPKPDIHIKDVLTVKNKRNTNYYNNEKRELELISEMAKITDDINAQLSNQNEKNITVYQLDRMIWLVCTENFFLHNGQSNKKSFIDRIN